MQLEAEALEIDYQARNRQDYEGEKGMKNRIKKYTNITSLEDLIKDINRKHNSILGGDIFTEGDILTPRPLFSWETDIKQLILYERHAKNIGEEFTSSEDVTALINALNTISRLLQDPEAPDTVKALMQYFFSFRLRVIALKGFDNKYTAELFNRRNEIEKPNPLRNRFITEYIEWDRYRRYDESILSKMNEDELEKYDEDYANLSEEEKEKQRQEDDARLKSLYEEYGEGDLLTWKDSRDYLSKLPDDLKEDRKKRQEESHRALKAFARAEEIKEKEGLTDDEAIERLTQEEKDVLEKGGLFIED
jgi:hypothetical protein